MCILANSNANEPDFERNYDLREKLDFSISPNKHIYKQGEPIFLALTWTNNSSVLYEEKGYCALCVSQIEVVPSSFESYVFNFLQQSYEPHYADPADDLVANNNIVEKKDLLTLENKDIIKPGDVRSTTLELTTNFIFKPGSYKLIVYPRGKHNPGVKIVEIKVDP